MAEAAYQASGTVRDQVTEEEWALRVELAACYRLCALFGWNDYIFTHISVRLPGNDRQYLINPFGLFFDEITASSLVKIDQDGEILLDDTGLGYNIGGYVIHGAVHGARDDAHCVIHLHTNEGVAVSGQKDGLLPLNQDSMSLLPDLAYHDFEGIALDTDERDRLVDHIGDKNAVILRNHGLLTMGPDVASAFSKMYSLQKSCTMQVMTLAGGVEIGYPSQDAQDKVREQVAGRRRPTTAAGGATNRISVPQLAWNGFLRKLDKVDQSYKD
ncbi:MAG: class II aldolase/adducin family protein [Rhodospirillaceae bacterium]|jgi:ribulose-5-phosphate 4-epimerase/fuculose-1-phosphate aldolase|nr:class II aldolase/adducin family protein [Rhodospirillaceae bacterium]MBT5239047.1 class II aldolase/adducin family protein [Rhodospirillaceae bacterium]MBT5565372.1 class II aldolase/adducin family protein [Rhodospirillaceae bacterium]MBT6089111.1 class II aldolase/adducin family protein [Rhodospirillaceae bacterium]MBT7451496.1 class II aldolase/adducin family protein [Rhodospirillaceae bacterium]